MKNKDFDDFQDEIERINQRNRQSSQFYSDGNFSDDSNSFQRAYKIQNESVDYDEINRARQIAENYNYTNQQRIYDYEREQRQSQRMANPYSYRQEPRTEMERQEQYEQAMRALIKDKKKTNAKEGLKLLVAWCGLSLILSIISYNLYSSYVPYIIAGQAVCMIGIYIFCRISNKLIALIPSLIFWVAGGYLIYYGVNLLKIYGMYV